MKLITWNCQMAFRNKVELLLAQKPNVMVIQECEVLDKLNYQNWSRKPTSALWYGRNLHKGLAIFSFGKYELSALDQYTDTIRWVVPIELKKGEVKYSMLAIWAHHPEDPDGRYVEQIWKALAHYDELIQDKNTLLLGDFNSNSIWDRKSRLGNHTDVVNRLAIKNIHSCYHFFKNQEHGTEKHPTFYLYRHLNKPYHLDYCFVSNDLLKRLSKVEVGNHSVWTSFSDHMPLVIKFKHPTVFDGN